MEDILHIDFETRSSVDLRTKGLAAYVAHPSTSILMMGYAFNEEPIEIWLPKEDFPMRVINHIVDVKPIVAHNINFEIQIFNQLVFPGIQIEQCECTMAMAYAMALPGSLENAAAALGIKEQKDLAGSRLMLQMSKPRRIEEDGTITWWDEEEKMIRLAEYCKQDVIVERELHKRLVKLSDKERKVWELDFEINQRGIHIDKKAARAAAELVQFEKKRLDKNIQEISSNQIATCQAVKQISDFVKEQGVDLKGIAKSDIISLLEQESLPQLARDVLLLRQEASKSSMAKLDSMVNIVSKDNRMRYIFQYCGAATGRWAGRKVQPHNFFRPTIGQEAIDFIFEVLLNDTIPTSEKAQQIEMFHPSVLSALPSCLRGFMCAADKNKLIGCDYEAIEARVIAWLAKEEKILEVFRGDGKIYEQAASDIYGVPKSEIKKDSKERQIGKVAVLALGFGGGKGAFLKMAKGYGLKVGEEESEKIKIAWRLANPNIVKYWYNLERAALAAIDNPSRTFSVGDSKYKVNGSFLWCQLPSGRLLCYPYPQIQLVKAPWGEMKNAMTYMAEDSQTRKWTRTSTYGGSLCENITQAVARDLLAEAMLRLRENKYPIAIHVHDEIVCEVPIESKKSVKEMEQIMSENPSWATGLPISAKGFEGIRYRK